MLVRRELKVKYRGSFLGYLWSMLNPLLTMITISVVFSFLVRGIENYSIYVLSGLLFWNLCANSLNLGAGSIVAGAGLIKKVKMPIEIFPIVPVLTFTTNSIFALAPYIVIFLALGAKTPPSMPFFPVVLLLFVAFLAGISLLLAVANVFFRDVGHIVEPTLQMLMYATPIIYDRDNPVIPEKLRTILGINPFTHFVEAGRKTIFGGQPIELAEMAFLASMATVSLVAGILVFRWQKSRIIFEL
jgi:ABC-2 type transport system permease protein